VNQVRVEIPDSFNAATFFVDRHLAEGRGGRVAFRAGGSAITYAELGLRVNRCAAAWRGLGVEIENRILIALPDTPDFAAAFWGGLKIGAVAVPVSPWLEPSEYEFLLDDSRAKVAVVTAELVPVFLAARSRCPFLREVVVAGPRAPGASTLEALLAAAAPALDPAPTAADDAAYWGYTSGSTGRPKAAIHLHKHFVHAAELVGVQTFGFGPDDVALSASKMFFAFGLGNSLYFPARVGAAAILEPGRVGPERAFELITRERPTLFFAVPTLYARMLEVPDAGRRFDLGSLRMCVSSGEALPLPVFQAWKARFGQELVDVLGSTEALHDFIASRPGRVRPGAVGEAIPGFETRLVDDAGNRVPPGTVGHLLVRGETIATGYWRRDERTRATMLGAWLRTGDMGFEDADGYFHYRGRSDDMLKVGGLWVSPLEVETLLIEHPAVREAAVIGGEDGDGLVRPHAFVVLAPGREPGEALAAELRGFVRARLAAHKTPAGIEFVPTLPRTSTGKIQRFRLREERLTSTRS
jgi:benzoate-CoA ligase family protein